MAAVLLTCLLTELRGRLCSYEAELHRPEQMLADAQYEFKGDLYSPAPGLTTEPAATGGGTRSPHTKRTAYQIGSTRGGWGGPRDLQPPCGPPAGQTSANRRS